jgi:hypothetical protein
MMGQKEANYIKGAASGDPLFKDAMKVGEPICHLFYISDEWLANQRVIWSGKVNTLAQSWLQKTKPSKTPEYEAYYCFGWMQPSRPQNALDVFRGPLELSNNDILVSWFYRLVEATVGLLMYNFRNRIPTLTDSDAGNYIDGVPYMAEDYKTPLLIHRSINHARRVGADRLWNPTTLPAHRLTATHAAVSNWSTFGRSELTLNGGSTNQGLHLSLFFAKDIKIIPSTMSLMILFNAGPEENKPAALVVACESDMKKIDESGIVQKTIARF